VPLELSNLQHVQVMIADVDANVAAYFDAEEWEASKGDGVSLAEVGRALSSIRGSRRINVHPDNKRHAVRAGDWR